MGLDDIRSRYNLTGNDEPQGGAPADDAYSDDQYPGPPTQVLGRITSAPAQGAPGQHTPQYPRQDQGYPDQGYQDEDDHHYGPGPVQREAQPQRPAPRVPPAPRPGPPQQPVPNRQGMSAPSPERAPQRAPADYDFSRDAQEQETRDEWDDLPSETTGSDVRTDPASKGFRGALNRMLHINLGKGTSEIEYDGWISEINTPLRGSRVIGVASGKGGVGKTSFAAMLGNTLAEHRSEGRIVGVDLDYRGSLADRIADVAATPAASSVAEFADSNPATPVNQYSSYMNTSREGFSILPAVTRTRHPALTEAQFASVIKRLREYAAIIILDFGADESAAVTHPAYGVVDTMVMVTSTERDSIKATKGRIRAMHDYSSHLTSSMTVVVNHRTQAKTTVDLDAEVKMLQGRRMDVLETSFDEHVSEAGAIKLGLCDPSMARQMVKLAATVVAKVPKT